MEVRRGSHVSTTSLRVRVSDLRFSRFFCTVRASLASQLTSLQTFPVLLLRCIINRPFLKKFRQFCEIKLQHVRFVLGYPKTACSVDPHPDHVYDNRWKGGCARNVGGRVIIVQGRLDVTSPRISAVRCNGWWYNAAPEPTPGGAQGRHLSRCPSRQRHRPSASLLQRQRAAAFRKALAHTATSAHDDDAVGRSTSYNKRCDERPSASWRSGPHDASAATFRCR